MDVFHVVVTVLSRLTSTLVLTLIVPDILLGEKWKLCCWTFTYYVLHLVVFLITPLFPFLT